MVAINHSRRSAIYLGGLRCANPPYALQQGDTAEIAQVIEQLLAREDWQAAKSFLHKLQAILAGECNPALAEDDEMFYEDVVELKLLLEQSS